jgi:hypothetical protein
MIGLFVDDELERIWREVILAYHDICLQELWKTQTTSSRIIDPVA